jgi:hypothetical protein
MAFQTQAAKKNPWTLPQSELTHVYHCAENDRTTELLRLYADGTFEHLLFERKSTRREQVERNLGTYIIKKGRIEFQKPSQSEFTGKFKYGSFLFKNGKLFENRIDATFRADKEVFKQTDERHFHKPFFIKLKEDEVVNNSGAAELLKMTDLVNYLLQNQTTDAQKLRVLEEFVVRSVEFDSEGIKVGKLTNEQMNSLEIVVGSKRVATSVGYAYALRSLCLEAGLDCKRVEGVIRDKSNVDKLTSHNWNIVTVNGQQEIHDILLADNGENLDEKWINVAPEVFVNSHLPLNEKDQLLTEPVSKEAFQSSPLLTSSNRQNSLPQLHLKRDNYFKDALSFEVSGIHSVQVYQLPASLLNVVYRGENPKIAYTLKPMEAMVSEMDGKTVVSLPLTDHLNLLRVVIDGDIQTDVKALKNGPEAIFKHYMAVAVKTHADSFVRGILSSVKMNDTDRLKALVGDTSDVFFSAKKKLILPADIVKAISLWNGELSALTIEKSMIALTDDLGNPVFDEQGIPVQEEKQEWYMETPVKVRVYMVKEEKAYRVDRVVKMP